MERATEFKSSPDSGWSLLIDKQGRRSAVGCILGEDIGLLNPNLGLPLTSSLNKKEDKMYLMLTKNGVDWERDKKMLFALESMHNSLRAEIWDSRMRQIAKDEGLLYEY